MILLIINARNNCAVINTLKNASILPVLAIIGLVLLMVLLEGCILTVITRIYNKKYHVYHGVINGLIGECQEE